jgi:hypothetical protein
MRQAIKITIHTAIKSNDPLIQELVRKKKVKYSIQRGVSTKQLEEEGLIKKPNA